jgi:hypothetical protein
VLLGLDDQAVPLTADFRAGLHTFEFDIAFKSVEPAVTPILAVPSARKPDPVTPANVPDSALTTLVTAAAQFTGVPFNSGSPAVAASVLPDFLGGTGQVPGQVPLLLLVGGDGSAPLPAAARKFDAGDQLLRGLSAFVGAIGTQVLKGGLHPLEEFGLVLEPVLGPLGEADLKPLEVYWGGATGSIARSLFEASRSTMTAIGDLIASPPRGDRGPPLPVRRAVPVPMSPGSTDAIDDDDESTSAVDSVVDALAHGLAPRGADWFFATALLVSGVAVADPGESAARTTTSEGSRRLGRWPWCGGRW